MAEVLASLKQQRSSAKANISRIKNLLDSSVSWNVIDLECRLDILNSYIKQIMAYQTEIEKIDPNDEKRPDVEELCVATKSKILTLLGPSRKADATFMETTLNTTTNWHRLPKLKLPSFSGTYSEYTAFITSFRNLVHNEESLPKIEKFNHLLACLSGDALQTVQAFQVTEDNYCKALDRLAERYNKRCLIFFDHIEHLLALPKINQPNASLLRNAVDTTSAIYDSLSTLGSDKDIVNALLIQLVMSKVDTETKSKWNDQLDYSELPTWDDCSKVIIRQCQSIDIRDEKADQPKVDASTYRKTKNTSYTKNKPKATLTCTSSSNDVKCYSCNSKNHYIQNCEAFITLPISDRFESVKSKGLCINCLRKGHSVSSCKSSRCRVCQRSHNTLLHRYDVVAPVPTSSNIDNSQTVSLQCLIEKGTIILATAVVYIKDKYGVDQMVRAILDSGSQTNFISEDTVQRLQLKRERGSLQVAGIGGKPTSVKQHVSIVIKSRVNNFTLNTNLWIIKSIASQQPESTIPIQGWNIPANLELADPYFYKRQKIDLLLGAETFFDLLSVGQIKLHSTLPTLQKTSFGWIVSGRYTPRQIVQTCNFVEECKDNTPFDIDTTLRKFWELEEVSSPRSLFTAEQTKCEEHFVKTTKLLPNKRFSVQLPFKMEPNILGASFDMASRRFYALERRLSKTPKIQQMYHEFMKEYLTLGHMEPINHIPSNPHFFIPHQCVLRMESTSTKLRVVFDASARTSTQTSLNEILMVGPTIQPSLYITLLRFRLYKYAVSADITKMYRQILVDEADRKFQLLVWRESVNKPLQMYQLNTVTYGTASAPFLAIRCLKELSIQFQQEFPLGSKVLNENFYVDDMLCGADTVNELCAIKDEVVAILRRASFELAKWCTNWKPTVSSIELALEKEHTTRTLGMIWNAQHDVLRFKLSNDFDQVKATKRNILSIASRLFDPLGLLCPIMIQAKLILQDLWLQKVDWDESIPMCLNTSWNQFKEELNSIQLISVPRFMNTICTEKIEIHGFSDASLRAYGCCIYVRRTSNKTPMVQLLTAKSKVAPIKTKSLPRLELCAAHLLAKLWQSIQSTMEKYVNTITFWTDSEITLYWLNTHPATLSTFVGNRVSEIQEWCKSISWRHVPTKQNPADITSRGSTVHNLMENNLWFNGPEFLKRDQSQWPKNPKFEVQLNNEALELRKQHNVCLNILNEENIIFRIVQDKSSYLKIVKIVAYMYRFINNTKNVSNRKGYSIVLNPKELNWAFLKIVSTIQLTEFKNEIRNLENGRILQNSLQKLNPFVHEYTEDTLKLKLLRVGGRLLNASLDFNTKCPLLLTKSSPFVIQYVRHLHMSHCHAGVQVLVGLMRQLVWVVNARQVARSVVRSCIHCFRYKPKLAAQLMGQLPQDRLQSLRPFYVCGVDFCGPFQTSHRIRGRQPYKTYCSIFVCFSTKAIHIELVSELTSNAFISVLKRFISRRGLPKKIYCDNATNFVGANSKLKDLRDFIFNNNTQTQLQNYTSQRSVEFAYIPPRSPHFGGLWEASVKSTKNLLYKTVGNVNLTYEELLTILHEIEAILNSRPLSALTDDPNDGEALTPAHWLVGSSLHALPDNISDTPNQNLSSLKRWQLISALKQQFWCKFQRDYILAQQCRNKWSHAKANLEVGALVVMHEDNIPPQQWKLGRVVAAIPGSDGKVRVVDIKTRSGIYRRAIHKLAVLPVS